MPVTRLFRSVAVVAAVTTGVLAGPGALVASAAAPTFVSSVPAAGAVVKPRATVVLTFAEDLSALSTVSVVEGSTPVLGSTSVGGNNRTLTWTITGAPGTNLDDGVYTASYTARAQLQPSDATPGSVSFTIDGTAPAAPTALATTGAVGFDNQANLGVSGTGEPGATVSVSVDDAGTPGTAPVVKPGTVAGNGAFAVTGIDVTALADGTLTASVTVTDTAGNVSAPGTTTVPKDTAAPDLVSAVPAVDGGMKSGKAVSATYDETLKNTSTIEVRNKLGNELDGATTFDGAKIVFTATDDLTPSGSPYAVTVVAVDAGGASATTTYSFVVDDTAPATPTVVIANPVNAANKAAVPVSGTAEPGSTVAISLDDATPGSPVTKTVTAAAGGTYETTLDATALADTALTVSVTAKDLSGNISAAATAASVKDTAAPAAPAALEFPAVNAANQAAVAIKGTAEPGSTVSVSVDDAGPAAPVTGTATAAAETGAFTVTLNLTPLADGTLTATAAATDPAGNPSAPQTIQAAKDATPPGTPSATVTNPVNAANQAAVTVSGVATAGRPVTVRLSDADTTTVDQVVTAHATTGAYSVSLDASTLDDGTLTARVFTTDPAGNDSATRTVTTLKDATAPGAPGLSVPAYANNGSKAALPVSGTAEPGSVVQVVVTDGGAAPVTKSATAAGNGDWATTVNVTSLADGPLTVTATATDASGNTSAPTQKSLDKDVVAPGAPAITTPATVTAADQAAYPVSGTAAPGSVVSVAVSDGVAPAVTGTATAAAETGAWSVTFNLTPLADGTLSVLAHATDAAGNDGPQTTTSTVKDTADLAFVSSSPAHGATVKPPAAVSVTANQLLDATSTITVRDNTSSAIAGTRTFGTGGRTLVFTPNSALPPAGSPYTATWTLKDAGSDDDQVTGSATFTVDSTAPAAPSVTYPSLVNAANAAATTASGTAEPGATVTITVDDATAALPVTGTTTADGAGAWSKTLDVTSLGDGALTVVATATDVAGNVSPNGTAASTKDATAPAAPGVSVPTYVNAASAGDVVVTGTTEPGATLAVSIDDATPGSPATGATTAAGNGSYTVHVDATSLADGALSVSVVSTDPSGNASNAATAASTKDTGLPATPAVAMTDPIGSANAGAISVSGTADPGTALTVSVDDAATPGTAPVTAALTVPAGGSYQVTLNVTGLADGTLTATVVSTDAAGNASAAGTDTATKDSAAPTTPTVAMPAVVNAATDNAVVVHGDTQPGSTVDVAVTDGSSSVTDTVTAGGTGAWTTTLDLSGLADGTLTATAVATDEFDNVSGTGSTTATKDATAPATPTVTGPAVVGTPTMTDPLFSGSTEPLATVAVTVSDGTAQVSGTATADLAGVWSKRLNLSGLADGTLGVSAVATDAAGNPSAAGTTTLKKDTVAPAAPGVSAPAYVNAAQQAALALSGTAEPDAILGFVVTDGTTSVTGIATADGAGAWTKSLDVSTLADGTLTVEVRATDAGGNGSDAGTATTAKDTVAPTAPGVTLASYVNAAGDDAVALSGTAEPGSSVAVALSDGTTQVAGTPTTGGNGAWNTTLNASGLSDGTLTATAVATDAAGNSGAAGTASATKDTVPPAAPVVSAPALVGASGAGAVPISGTAQPGTEIAVAVSDGTTAVTGTATPSGSGAWSKTLDLSGLGDGVLGVSATATDPAGNVSAAGTTALEKDTAPPAVPTVTLPAVDRTNQAAVTVSGTAEPGATIALSVADGAAGQVPGTATAAAGTGAWSTVLDLSGLADGTLTATATATDPAGNAGSAGTATATKNTRRVLVVDDLTSTPVSGTPVTFTVTAHQTLDPGSGTDLTYTGTPVLTAPADTHFAGTCGTAVAGVSTCSGVVFGDLGAATLTATGDAADTPATANVTVMPTGLVWSVAPPATINRGQVFPLQFAPTAGVTGADVSRFAAARTLHVTGTGASPADGTVLTCAAATCSTSMSFATGGTKTVRITAATTPQVTTPTMTVTVPNPSSLTLVAPTITTSGTTVRISGVLRNTSNGVGVPAAPVQLWVKVAPRTTFSPLRTVTTGSNGVWTTTVRLDRHTALRVTHSGSAALDPAASPTRSVTVRTAVYVSSPASGTTVRAGQVFRVTGYVRPATTGQSVSLVWLRPDGRRVGLAGAKTGSGGGYVLSRSLPRGTYTLYVTAAGTATNSSNGSRSFTLRVV